MLNTHDTRTQHIALWISRIGHPFILPLVTLLVLTLKAMPPQEALAIVGLAGVTVTAPIVVYIRRQIRGQRWTDYDVSVREHRYGLYPLILGALGLGVVAFWLLDGPAPILRGMAACALLAFIAMLVNLVSKISLHTSLSTFCAVAMLALNLWLGVAACIFVALIGWSRVVLRRHTPFEVVCGVLLGGSIGGALVWLG